MALGVGLLMLPFTSLVGCGANKGTGFATSSGSGGNSGSGSSSGGGSSSSGGSGSGGNGGGSSGSLFDGGSSSGGSSGAVPPPDGGFTCPAGLTCDVTCSGNATTTISGKVYDPAGKNPLYNVAVYVPITDLQPLPKGVPTGADACSCSALFKSGAITSATTGVDGSFTLKNAPTGSNVPLVLQVGKWRRVVHINVAACQDNSQADKSLTLPGSVPAGNTDDNMPDIAVSTGSKDTLECLMLRIGLPASEYVAGAGGAGSTGHIHVFSGGMTNGGGGGTSPGSAEDHPMPGAPASYTDLWASQDQLMPYDITLLSCEGGETYNANPPALESYLNAGGRVFASHYHYAWFSGPFSSKQSYMAPSDWGTNLATWANPDNTDQGPIGGIIDTTLNGSTMQFPKGVALQQWLSGIGALGLHGVPAGELSIYAPRYNSVVMPTHKPSQPWIDSDMSSSGMGGQTMYFSFDTPVDLNPPPAGPDPSGGPVYCGRAVFSDLHVAGDPMTNDSTPPPSGCAATDLSPQEKALEFMLFDLSSCVIPDTIVPPPVVVPPPQ
jgi:hypothetical protein